MNFVKSEGSKCEFLDESRIFALVWPQVLCYRAFFSFLLHQSLLLHYIKMAKNIILVSLALYQALLSYLRYRNVHIIHNSVVHALNKTADANQTLMIFNQVPKTGSENMIHLIDSLSLKNNFMNISSNPAISQKYGHYFDEDFKKFYINMLLFCEIENTLGQKSSIYPNIHIFKISFLTKFTFSKSHF